MIGMKFTTRDLKLLAQELYIEAPSRNSNEVTEKLSITFDNAENGVLIKVDIDQFLATAYALSSDGRIQRQLFTCGL